MNRYLFTAFYTVIGAVIYRIRGGLAPAMPRPMDQILFGLPFAAIVYRASGRNAVAFFFTLAITAGAVATGHGQYMDLATVTRPVDPETLDFIVQWFFGDDNFNDYWRDFFGLAVTGIAVSLPAGLMLIAYGHRWQGVVLALSGASKAVAYAISWKLMYGTEGGELLTGAFAWLSVCLLWWTIDER